MGVVSDAMAGEASNQSRYIKTPADYPKHLRPQGLTLQLIGEKRMFRTALPICNYFSRAKSVDQTGGLHLNTEPTTTEAMAGSWDQKTNQLGGHRRTLIQRQPPCCRPADGG